MASPSTAGSELDYFHAYKLSKTYAIEFKDGLRASIDFSADVITLDDGVTSKTVPLLDALIEANGGNVGAAEAMYAQMYSDITAAQSDAIITYDGVGTYNTHLDPFPRWDDRFGQAGGALWSTPRVGEGCWPIPNPCHEWSGGLTNLGLALGSYSHWWGGVFGDKPPTPQPPSPSGCAPGDNDCVARK